LLVVNPIGDFPLNDDWAYAENVKALVVDHKIYFSDWPAMTLIVHTVWGALFCKIFGFSFTVLRFSNLIMGWFGLLATYALFREGNFSKKNAFWCTLLIGFNPIYFSLSYTYMTDVPFYTLVVMASLYFIKALNGKGDYNIIFATLYSVLAVLMRQLGVLMPLAFLFIFLIKRKITLKSVFQAVTPLVLTYGIMSAFIKWREVNYGLSETFSSSGDLFKLVTWERFCFFMENLAQAFTSYWGFFLLPLITLLFPFLIKKIERKILLISGSLSLVILFLYWGKWNFTIIGNIIYNMGLGPKLISYHSTNKAYEIPAEIWIGIKAFMFFVGLLLVFIFLVHLFKNLFNVYQKRKIDIDPVKGFSFFAASIYLGFLTFNFFYFDRYHLQLLPFFILIIFPKKLEAVFSKWSIKLATLFFVIQVLYSVGATHDYLSYSRSNWNLLHDNMEKLDLLPERFAGGFEFNCWYKHGGTKPHLWYNKKWWLSDIKNYATDFGTSCGFTM